MLLIEDNDEHAQIVTRHLRRIGHAEVSLTRAATLREGLVRLTENAFDAILLDLKLPDSNVGNTLSSVLAQASSIPIVVLSTLEERDFALNALQEGAQDYVCKSDLSSELLFRAIDYAIERYRVTRKARNEARQKQSLFELGQRTLAATTVRGLLGEAATLLARALHAELVGIWELGSDGTSFRLGAGVGWNPELIGRAVVPAELQPFGALGTFEHFIVNDLRAVPSAPKLLIEHGVVSGISVALRGQDDAAPYGVLTVHTLQRRDFGADEAHFLQTAANVIAAAILRIQAEGALRESEERFRALADDSPVMIWVTDANGMVQFGNRAYCDFFGTSLEVIKNEGWQPLVHPEDASGYVTAFSAASNERRPFRSQARVRRGDGQWRWVESYGQPRYSASGDFLGMAGSSPDISEQKAAERLREMFIGILGHDLRNPLGAMVMAVQQVMTIATEDAVKRPLQRILSSGERMERMIDQLLDLTRIRLGGGIVLSPQAADLRAILEQVMLGLAAAKERFRIETFGDTCGTWDTDRIFQVVSNLAGNACEHSPAGTVIHVRIDGRATETVEMRISNAGPAVPQPVRTAIFEPFRGSGERQQPSRGLGLGLYITKHLVVAHGGAITIESTDEDGTAFTVCLPRHVNAAE